MSKIGIVGSSGFLGNTLLSVSDKYDHEIISITKNNFKQLETESFDILINSATPSKKFWAQNNPYDDFLATVTFTANLVYNWHYTKFIQISTISVNDTNKHPYTINKKAAEVISSHADHLIVRLSNLYGHGLNKGPLFDLLNNKKIHVHIDSEYSFINTEFVANWIFKNLDRTGIVELGAKDTISLREIMSKQNLNPEWEGNLEQICPNKIEPNMPSCTELWNFIQNYDKLR